MQSATRRSFSSAKSSLPDLRVLLSSSKEQIQDAYRETGAQAVSYTTGVPAMIGALLFLTGQWKGTGVMNTEQFDPDPFMEQLKVHGLPWHELHDIDLEV